jgi:hypothetical protein
MQDESGVWGVHACQGERHAGAQQQRVNTDLSVLKICFEEL